VYVLAVLVSFIIVFVFYLCVMCVTCLLYCCTTATGLKPNCSLTNIYNSSRPDDGGNTFLRNIGSYKSHTVSHPRRRQ
jgi:hypothetical protein